MSWTHVKGHDAQIDAFARLYGRGRLAHAYLFTGPPGVGKALFACELAKALACEGREPDALAACDACASCRLVDADTHPDVTRVGRPEGKFQLPIETIRELCAWMALSAARTRHKIAVVDDAEFLNVESSNAFLKTLEEPPPGSVLVLVTSRVEDVLPTIQSRCQTVRFGALTPETIGAILVGPPHDVPADRAAFLARSAGGSVAQALRFADPGLWELRAEVFRRLVGLGEADALGVGEAIHDFAKLAGKENVKVRESAAVLLELLAALWRDVAVWLAGGRRDELLLAPDSAALMAEVGDRVELDVAVDAVERVLATCDEIRRMAHLRLTLDAMCADLARMQGGARS